MPTRRFLAALLLAQAALAAGLHFTQRWTNQHLFAHGGPGGHLLGATLALGAALIAGLLLRRTPRPWIPALAVALTALAWAPAFWLLHCQPCAASG